MVGNGQKMAGSQIMAVSLDPVIERIKLTIKRHPVGLSESQFDVILHSVNPQHAEHLVKVVCGRY